MNCRLCNSLNLTQFLDLGFTPPADGFLRREQLKEPETYYPLKVVLCPDCGQVQLNHTVSGEILYRHDYPYESSITKAGYAHWSEFAETVTSRLKLTQNDLAIDIGSNVGVLLECFKNCGVRILGVDPASNIVRIAEKRGIETLCEFFGVDVAKHILSSWGKASVITGTNVFAHVDDLRAMMAAVDMLLNENGVFIFEAPYFVNLLKHLEYDTIYHEHLSYLSVKPLVPFFKSVGMEIFDIEERDIHGGSFRVYIAREGRRPVQPIVGELLEREIKEGVHTLEVLNKFSQAVQQNRQELRWMLTKLKHEGNRIAAVSAPAKGMTLLNYCGLGAETFDFCTEKSTLKIGRVTPGTHIPIFPDDELLKQMPEYALLLAWNFSKEIMNNLKEYKERGGKFIIPVPVPTIV